MNYKIKARAVVEKFKNQHNITGSVSNTILESIAESLHQIDAAKNAMEEDSLQQRIDAHGQVYHLPYGITLNRFGEQKQHPGIQNVKIANDNIRACLKTLNVSPEVKGEKSEKPKGKLRGMIG